MRGRGRVRGRVGVRVRGRVGVRVRGRVGVRVRGRVGVRVRGRVGVRVRGRVGVRVRGRVGVRVRGRVGVRVRGRVGVRVRGRVGVRVRGRVGVRVRGRAGVRVRGRVGVRVRGRAGVRVRGRVGVRVRGRVGVRVRGSSARGGGPVGAVLAEGGVEAVRGAEHVERVGLAGRVPQLLDAEDLRLGGQRPPHLHLALELGLELERQLIAAAGGRVVHGVHHHVDRLRQRVVQLVAHAPRLGIALRQLPQPRHPLLLRCAAPRRGDGRPCRTRGGRGGEGDGAAGDMAPSAGGQGLAAAAATAALAAAAKSGAPWPAAATEVGGAGPLGVERRLPLVQAAVGQRRVAVGQRAARGAARALLGWRRLGWRRLGWRRRLSRALRWLPSRLLALLRRGSGRAALPDVLHRTQHLAADDLAAAGDDAVRAAVGALPARAQLKAGGVRRGLARRQPRRQRRGNQ